MKFRYAIVVVRLSLWLMLLAPTAAWSQTNDCSSPSEKQLTGLIEKLQGRLDELESELKQMHEEANTLRTEATELRQLLNNSSHEQAQYAGLNAGAAPAEPEVHDASIAGHDQVSVKEKVAFLEQNVKDQYQTKVESGSRYRVRFSGLLLLNLFANRGNADTIEDPSVALPIDTSTRQRGSIGGTLRQTELGFQVSGPTVFGAQSGGNVQFDFSGGLAPTPGGETMGIVRLRTGTIRLDWQNTSIVAGQDDLFFSPLQPTSYASLQTPPLAYAGNLWGWIPQARIEQRFGFAWGSNIIVEAGILDPTTGQIPDLTTNARPAGAGEQSRQPGIGAHIGWSRRLHNQILGIGTGGYYGKQQYQVLEADNAPPSNVRSWLLSADWQLPLTHWLGLSGSFYRGSALGGLGGGLGQSVDILPLPPDNPNPPPDALAKGVKTAGGWSQLKIRPFEKLEWNLAAGSNDNPFGSQSASGTIPSYFDTPLSRNRAAFSNLIYRPRTDLLLSLEFRHLESFPIQDKAVSTNQLNMAMGIFF